MPSIISADNGTISGSAGLKSSADSSGILELRSGANTTGAQLDASQNFKMNSGYGSVATAYGCRAWVNFNGTGTVAIRASGNVSSITDNGVGDYTVNFTTAMPDANYAVVGMTQAVISSTVAIPVASVIPNTTSVRVRATNGGTFYDGEFVSVVVFR